VLLSAYQCGPGMGSVSQIGWEWYSRLARRVPVTLATHIRNRAALDAAGAPVGDSRILYVDTEWFAGPLYRAARRLFPSSEHAVFLLSSADFYVYDRQLLRKLRREPERWSLVHAPTPVSPLAATVLHRLGRPVILGPWNGGLATPATFPELMRADAAWFYRLRVLGRVMNRIAGSTRHAALILSATRATDESVLPEDRGRCVRMLENGVDLERFGPAPWPPGPSPEEPLRVLFVGRLIPAKGVPLLIEAARRLRGEVPLAVCIVGDGPAAEECRRQAEEWGLGGTVEFAGARPLEEIPGFLHGAHVLCLPSVRESGGGVLLEAMACARPVIAVRHGGPAEIVDDAVGALVPADGPEAAVAGLVEALRDLARNAQAWRQRGECGRRRAEAQYGWEAKIETVLELYRRVLAGAGAAAPQEVAG